LGPFDYNQYQEEEEDQVKLVAESEAGSEQLEDGRTMQLDWETRRSGAQYRGEIAMYNRRPDGRGIKVYQGKSLYEGYFSNGMCNGWGRGITSAGEVYQGGFAEDQMEGKGFFHWPDGRIFEGEYLGGKKHGKGKFFEANG